MPILLRVSAALALFMCGMHAQSFISLNGTVSDASGGVVPSVAIEIKNKETQAARSILSDSQGRYVFAEVVPGRYRLEAEASGFKAQVVERTPVAGQLTYNDQSLVAGRRGLRGHRR